VSKFGKILVASWVLFWIVVTAGLLLVYAIRPKPGPWLLFARTIRPGFFLLILVSFGYAVVWVYREGMKHARRPKSDHPGVVP
jgi:hypothetical protein